MPFTPVPDPSRDDGQPADDRAVGLPDDLAGNEICERCGSDRLGWRNCKLICANCRSIVKSCADL